MAKTSELQRREVFYEGRVQGVGFRYTASRIARQYAVTGFVRNLADGRVQLVAEGQALELDTFLAALERAMDPYILDRRVTTSSATGEFGGFRVAH